MPVPDEIYEDQFAQVLGCYFEGDAEALQHIVSSACGNKVVTNVKWGDKPVNIYKELSHIIVTKDILNHARSVKFARELNKKLMRESSTISAVNDYFKKNTNASFSDAIQGIDPAIMSADRPVRPHGCILDGPIAQFLVDEIGTEATPADIERIMPIFSKCELNPYTPTHETRFKIKTCHQDVAANDSEGNQEDQNGRPCDLQILYLKSSGQSVRLHGELYEIALILNTLEELHRSTYIIENSSIDKKSDRADELSKVVSLLVELESHGRMIETRREDPKPSGEMNILAQDIGMPLTRVVFFCGKRTDIYKKSEYNLFIQSIKTLRDILYPAIGRKGERRPIHITLANANTYLHATNEVRRCIRTFHRYVGPFIEGLQNTMKKHSEAVCDAITETFSNFNLAKLPELVAEKQSKFAHNDQQNPMHEKCKIFRNN